MAASDNITWRLPRSIAIVIAWSVINASIVLNAFLNGRQILAWFDFLFLFLISAFAGVLLADIKAIVLGVFESLFLCVLISYTFMILPVLFGNAVGFGQANAIYWLAIFMMFQAFFPTAMMMFVVGGMLGGFLEGLLS